MAAEVGFDVNATAYVNSLTQLARPKLDQAVALALVDTAKSAIVQATKAIAARTGLRSGTVKERIFYDRVNVGDYEARVKSSKRPIALKEFPGTRQVASGVQTRAWGKAQVIKSGFIIERFGRNFYRRKGRSRFPLTKLWGPTIGGTFAKPEVQSVVGATMQERLQKSLSRRMA